MKPGLQTTEFWTGAGVAGALLVLAFDASAPSSVRACAAIAAALASWGYAGARAAAKRRRVALQADGSRALEEGF